MFVFLNYLSHSAQSQVERARQYVSERKWYAGKDITTNAINADSLLDADPELFYLRAQCYHGLNQYKEAVEDLSRAITSSKFDKDKLESAYEIRFECNLKLGNFDDAEYDAGKSQKPELMMKIRQYKDTMQQIENYKKKGNYEEALLNYKELLKDCEKALNLMVEAAETALMADQYDTFDEISSEAVQLDSSNIKLLEMRGRNFLCKNDYEFAKRHFVACAQKAISASPCVSLNRQNNEMKAAYEKFEIAVNNSNTENAYTFSNKAYNIATKFCKNGTNLVLKAASMKAKALLVDGRPNEALSYVNEYLKDSPNSTDLLLEKGDILRKMNDNDAASKCYQQVTSQDKNNKRAQQAIDEIYEQREKEKKCDYYELLNLSRDCTRTQVRDAVRKAVRKYHPDQYSDPIKKKEMEKIMAHVNRANEILSDPQKKSLYDRGEDPDNPGFRPPPGGEQQYQYQQMRRGQQRVIIINHGGGTGFTINL